MLPSRACQSWLSREATKDPRIPSKGQITNYIVAWSMDIFSVYAHSGIYNMLLAKIGVRFDIWRYVIMVSYTQPNQLKPMCVHSHLPQWLR